MSESRSITQLVKGLQSSDSQIQLDSTRQLRKFLSEKDSQIDAVLDAKAVPLLTGLLSSVDSQLVYESCWALTNLVAGTTYQTRRVLDSGVLGIVVDLLDSQLSTKVKNQAAWFIGNVAGDTVAFRDMAVQLGALAELVKLVENSTLSEEARKNVFWAISNCLRHKPHLELEKVKVCLPVLAQQISSGTPLSECLYSLSYISDGSTENIQTVIDTGCVPRLVQILEQSRSDSNESMQIPAIRALGNILSGNMHQTQLVLDSGFLRLVPFLLESQNVTVQKEVLWSLSNISAGSTAQVQAVFDADLFPSVIAILKNSDSHLPSRNEAMWVIANALNGGSRHMIKDLANNTELIPAILERLRLEDDEEEQTKNVRIVLIGLESIECILKVGEGFTSPYNDLVEFAGGLDVLESLQTHESDAVYDKCVSIITRHFGVDSDESL